MLDPNVTSFLSFRTHLARNPSGNVLQRRTASPQIALEIDYKNTRLDPKLFLNELAPLVGAPDQNRLQVPCREGQRSGGCCDAAMLGGDGGGGGACFC